MKNTTDESSARITFTLDRDLKDEFDTTIKEVHYNTMSSALTEAIRDLIEDQEEEEIQAKMNRVEANRLPWMRSITLSLRDYFFIIGSIVYLGLGFLWDNPPFNIVVNWLIWFVGARLFFDWLCKDAEERGMDARRWQVVVMFMFPFGFMAYLFMRNPKQYQKQEIV